MKSTLFAAVHLAANTQPIFVEMSGLYDFLESTFVVNSRFEYTFNCITPTAFAYFLNAYLSPQDKRKKKDKRRNGLQRYWVIYVSLVDEVFDAIHRAFTTISFNLTLQALRPNIEALGEFGMIVSSENPEIGGERETFFGFL
jgi:hypothetical protein